MAAGDEIWMKAGMPRLHLQIGFHAAPLDALSSVAWTPVDPSYVRSWRSKRGRQNELAQFETGTLDMVLDNRDGRFDPANTASPHSPDITPMRRIRLRATVPDAVPNSSRFFDGTDDYITVPDAAVLDLTSAFTIELWVRPASGFTNAYVVRKANIGANPNSGYGIRLTSGGGNIVLERGTTDSATSAGALVYGEWNHVAVVFDNAANPKVRFYLNGVAAGTSNAIAGAFVANGDTLLVGRSGTGGFLGAYLDDLRIWNVARSAADIAADFWHELAGYEPGLVAEWKCNDESGTTVADSGPSALNGTAVGGPIISKGRRTFPIFTGYVLAWPTRYTLGTASVGDATTEIRCADAWHLLNMLRPRPLGRRRRSPYVVRSVYADTVMSMSPALFWRLGGNEGTVTQDETLNNRDGTATGSGDIRWDRPGPLHGDDDTAVVMSPNTRIDGGDVFNWERTQAWTIGFWIRPTIGTQTDLIVGRYANGQMSSADRGSGIGLNPQSDNTPQIQVRLNSGSGNRINVRCKTLVDPTRWTFIVVTYDGSSASTGIKIYYDGRLMSSDVVESSLTATIQNAGTFRVGGNLLAAGMDELAVYESALSATQIESLYDAGVAPWDGDRSSQRVGRVLDLADWPAGDRDLQTGIATLHAMAGMESVTDALRAAAEAEEGAVYISAEGKVRSDYRYAARVASASVATFGDLGDADPYEAAEFPYAVFEPDFDDGDLWNEVLCTSTRAGARMQRAVDNTSGAAYGPRILERTAPWSDDNQPKQVARMLRDRYKTPARRFKRLGFAHALSYQTWKAVLGRDLNRERITVKRRPLGAGVQTQDCAVSQITHQADADSWQIGWELSPLEPSTTYLAVGDQVGSAVGVAH